MVLACGVSTDFCYASTGACMVCWLVHLVLLLLHSFPACISSLSTHRIKLYIEHTVIVTACLSTHSIKLYIDLNNSRSRDQLQPVNTSLSQEPLPGWLAGKASIVVQLNQLFTCCWGSSIGRIYCNCWDLLITLCSSIATGAYRWIEASSFAWFYCIIFTIAHGAWC